MQPHAISHPQAVDATSNNSDGGNDMQLQALTAPQNVDVAPQVQDIEALITSPNAESASSSTGRRTIEEQDLVVKKPWADKEDEEWHQVTHKKELKNKSSHVILTGLRPVTRDSSKSFQ